MYWPCSCQCQEDLCDVVVKHTGIYLSSSQFESQGFCCTFQKIARCPLPVESTQRRRSRCVGVQGPGVVESMHLCDWAPDCGERSDISPPFTVITKSEVYIYGGQAQEGATTLERSDWDRGSGRRLEPFAKVDNNIRSKSSLLVLLGRLRRRPVCSAKPIRDLGLCYKYRSGVS